MKLGMGLERMEREGYAYLQLVDEHGDGVELIVRVRRVSHGERGGDRICDMFLDDRI